MSPQNWRLYIGPVELTECGIIQSLYATCKRLEPTFEITIWAERGPFMFAEWGTPMPDPWRSGHSIREHCFIWKFNPDKPLEATVEVLRIAADVLEERWGA